MQWYFLDAQNQQQPFDDESFAALVQGGQVTAETLIWNESMAEWAAAGTVLPDWFTGAPAAAAEPAAAAPAAGAAPMMVRPKKATGLRQAPAGTVPGSVLAPQGQGRQPAAASGRTGAVGAQPDAAPATEDSVALVRRLAGVMAPASGWMKLISVLQIIGGVLMVLMGLGGCLAALGLPQGKAIALLAGLFYAGVGALPLWIGILLWKGADRSNIASQTGDITTFEEGLGAIRKFFTILGVLLLCYLLLVVGIVLMAMMGPFGGLLMSGPGMGGPDFGPPGGLEAPPFGEEGGPPGFGD